MDFVLFYLEQFLNNISDFKIRILTASTQKVTLYIVIFSVLLLCKIFVIYLNTFNFSVTSNSVTLLQWMPHNYAPTPLEEVRVYWYIG